MSIPAILVIRLETSLGPIAEMTPIGGVISALRCLAHPYEFNLENGQCLNGNCPALEVELLSSKAG